MAESMGAAGTPGLRGGLRGAEPLPSRLQAAPLDLQRHLQGPGPPLCRLVSVMPPSSSESWNLERTALTTLCFRAPFAGRTSFTLVTGLLPLRVRERSVLGYGAGDKTSAGAGVSATGVQYRVSKT